MMAVVIPARNEASAIQGVITQALRLPVGLVIPVLNGCDDMTPEIVSRLTDRRIQSLQFREPLGYDIPRIAGAQAALKAGALAVLFVDGDLAGNLLGCLHPMVDRVRRGALDLALCDCYAATPVPRRQSKATEVYRARVALNEALGRMDLGAAIPSHGPVVVSRKLLETVPLAAVGVPPLMQALAVMAGLRVGVAAEQPHKQLGSTQRSREHRLAIAETIIGDCIQAGRTAHGLPPKRLGHMGYHLERRFDLVGLESVPLEAPAAQADREPAVDTREHAPAEPEQATAAVDGAD